MVYKKTDCVEKGMLNCPSNYLCNLDAYLGVDSICSCLIHKSETDIDFYALPCNCEERVIDNIYH